MSFPSSHEQEWCIYVPGASPMPLLSCLGEAGKQEEAALFWISLPCPAEQLWGCPILHLVQQGLGMVCLTEGDQGVQDPACFSIP